jgi:putative ABC transport system substrate-binding protein
MPDVGRRRFLTLLGGTAAWPLGASAQMSEMPLVGFIHGGAADAFARRVAAFRVGLNETGYVEGQNVAVEYQWLEGHFERLPAVLANLIQHRVAVIATPGSTAASIAAKAATATIPIVFGVAEDPVALGMVASLAQPGGNATGTNFLVNEIDAKRLGLMHELLPSATRFAVLVNPADTTSTEATLKALTEASRTLGVSTLFFKASTPDEIDAAFTLRLRVNAPMPFSSRARGSSPAAQCSLQRSQRAIGYLRVLPRARWSKPVCS